jgi:hypothetical protein
MSEPNQLPKGWLGCEEGWCQLSKPARFYRAGLPGVLLGGTHKLVEDNALRLAL